MGRKSRTPAVDPEETSTVPISPPQSCRLSPAHKHSLDAPQQRADIGRRHSGRLRRGARLGPLWQTVSLFNPVVCLIIGLRWTFYGAADVHIAVSTGMTLTLLVASLAVVWWVFKTGWKIRR